MNMLNIQLVSCIPSEVPDGIADSPLNIRREFFNKFCKDVVNVLWHELNTDSLKHGEENDDADFCCEEDKDEELIGCESRYRCIRGQWFHQSCAGVDRENLPDEWYCSEECQHNDMASYPYCYCRKNREGAPMIGCSAGEKCSKAEWYHLQCVGLSEETVPEGDWFCSTECNISSQQPTSKKRQKLLPMEPVKDHKYMYALAMTWSGLNLLCRRDAVREADGDAMVSHWKIDIVQFYRKKHVKYLILAHRLMAALNGWVPENVRQDLRWNRTVNYSGGIGRNLPVDLTNEFLNRLFKDLLKDAHGNHSSATIARCSQLIGPFVETLQEVFDENVTERHIYRHRRRDFKTDENVLKLVESLSAEHLFRVLPGRQYRSFPGFHHDENLAKPGNFLSKMKKLSERLDVTRAVAVDEPF